MARNIRELPRKAAKLPVAERAALERKAKEDLDHQVEAYERSLGEIRRARALTQEQLAKTLGVSQAQVSRIEHQTDLYLSTLLSYVRAMGGRIEIVAQFADEPDTVLAVSEAAAELEPA